MESLVKYYRKINGGFLNKAWREGGSIGFDIYCKAEQGLSQPKFLIFAHYQPANKDRIRALVESESTQDFYIHETDLIKYYRDFLIGDLKKDLQNGVPPEEVLEKAYHVTAQILKEYFENIGSSQILRTIKDVIQVMRDCLFEGRLGLADAYRLSRKANDHYSHCTNVGLYSMIFGIGLGLSRDAVADLGQGGTLLDIGKKFIPEAILSKKEKLSPKEFLAVRKHPSAGKKVLNDLKSFGKGVLAMVAEHHEKYDGTGYPFALSGCRISQFARMGTIADVWSALVAERDHRQPLTPFEALIEMKDKMPGHFDEGLLIDFIRLVVQSQQAQDRPARPIPAAALKTT